MQYETEYMKRAMTVIMIWLQKGRKGETIGERIVEMKDETINETIGEKTAERIDEMIGKAIGELMEEAIAEKPGRLPDDHRYGFD